MYCPSLAVKTTNWGYANPISKRNCRFFNQLAGRGGPDVAPAQASSYEL